MCREHYFISDPGVNTRGNPDPGPELKASFTDTPREPEPEPKKKVKKLPKGQTLITRFVE